ncbi:MAG: hypothetical protein JXR07_17910 [Reichenbachiella sp.]
MDKQEFFLIIPGVIYGVAIVDLLKVFEHKRNYFEIVGWGLTFMLGIVTLWINLYVKLDAIVSSNLSFLLIIVQSVLYSRGAHIITPEEQHNDTKAYFKSIRKQFFTLLALIVLCNLLIQEVVQSSHTPVELRILAVLLYVTLIVFDKVWLRTTVMFLTASLILLDLLIPGGLVQFF